MSSPHAWTDCTVSSNNLKFTRNTRIECGMSGVWMMQIVDNPVCFRKAMEEKLRDIWINEWYVNLNKNNCPCLSKFYTVNNELPFTTGRYNQIGWEERYCIKCNNRLIE